MAFSVWKSIPFAAAAATYYLFTTGRTNSYIGTFVLLDFCLTAIWYVYRKIAVPLWLSSLTKLPQPKGASFWNGFFTTIFTNGTAEVERVWMREIPNDGFIYYRSLLNQQRVILTRPEGLKEVMTRTYEFVKPPPILGLAEKLLGLGLVLSERDQHRNQRRAFLPIFAPRHVREMYPIFWSKTCEITETLTQIIQGQPAGQTGMLEVGHWSSRAALDIVTMATLGENFGAIQNENSELAKTYRLALEPSRGYLVLAMLKMYFPSWMIDALPNRWNKNLREYVPIFRNVCRRILHEKRRQAADKSLRSKDLLSLCFAYEETNSASEEELIDQMTTFLAAGHETISVGNTWAIYMFCLHPEWQTRVRAEVRANLPPPSSNPLDIGAPGSDDPQHWATAPVVENMPVLQAFIHEVLRWYPPIPETMRYATCDTTIQGLYIPQGTWVVLPIKGIHRDEACWGPDANVFNPERWLQRSPDGSTTFLTHGGCRDKFASLSFMQGVRSCVAQVFSKAEMACMLGAWVGRFEFELIDKELHDESKMVISKGSFSGRPMHGLYTKWTIVDGW